ncbi:MAG: alpha/beta hydrolase [Solirubrobacterales bacterium]|nr:alpha/beta hydrolase [Solirubrobacterales bacterium]
MRPRRQPSTGRTFAALLAATAAAALVATAPAPASTGNSDLPIPVVDAGGGLRKRVAIHDGRRLFIACRGSGSPTVVLEAGTGDVGRVWSLAPFGPGRAVLPAVARFTRVCVYDRPGTYLLPDEFSRSDPVAMPRTALDIAGDLRALLRAARVPGPYVLAGHSFGGMVARLYATRYPTQVAGLVSIDAQNEDFVAAYKEFLSPEQYVAAVLDPGPPPGLDYPEFERLALEASAAQTKQAQADTPLRRMPFVVLSHSRDLPNPFGFPSDWPIDALDHAFQRSQMALAGLLPRARLVEAKRSGHYIQLDQPRLVTREIRWVVRRAR